MKTLFSLLLTCSVLLGHAQQQPVNDTLTSIATIEHKMVGNQVQFNANAPALNQIAGAPPKAFYTNYWEFGDGTYSKENTPSKSYKKAGEYEVKLWATNNYDTGKPPTTRPKKIKVDNADNTISEEASMDDGIDLQRNRELSQKKK